MRRAPEAAETSTAVAFQPPFRCYESRLKISYVGPSQLLRRCSPQGVVGRDGADCLTSGSSSSTALRPPARDSGRFSSYSPTAWTAPRA